MSATSKPSIDSSEGAEYLRKLLSTAISHPLHDYILEGICKGLAGLHVLSVLHTGGGKTSYLYGFMKALEELDKLTEPCPFDVRGFPKNPLMIAVFPTKGLEEDMQKVFQKYNLNALVINEDTLANSSEDLWKKAASPDLSILLLSPEQMTTASYDTLIHAPPIRQRIVSLGVDELHLLLDWGAPGFRECYRDVGLGLARLPERTVMFGMTATLPAGAESREMVKVLGLKPGEFYFSRRSNIRRDIRLCVRQLRHGLGGWSFPDLRWVVSGRRKTIIYCDTISLAFRLFVELWYSIPDPETRSKRLRMYCSLFSAEHNEETRRMFVDDPDLQVIISTDALKVGNDFPNVADVIVLNPTNVNDILQKIGRAGRNPALVSNPRGIVYVTKNTWERARDVVDGKPPKRKTKKPPKGNTTDGKMTPEMARFLHARCFIHELNLQYDNPTIDRACTCQTCRTTPRPHPSICICSGCMPEAELPPLSQQARKTAHVGYIPRVRQLSASTKSKGHKRLAAKRREWWLDCEDEAGQDLPPSAFLPDDTILAILNNFHHLTDEKTVIDWLMKFIGGNKWALAHVDALAEEISTLAAEFYSAGISELTGHENTNTERPRQRARLTVGSDVGNSSQFGASSYDTFWTNLRATDTTTPARSAVPTTTAEHRPPLEP